MLAVVMPHRDFAFNDPVSGSRFCRKEMQNRQIEPLATRGTSEESVQRLIPDTVQLSYASDFVI